jgi:hypoxanthine phosphoribosyltransferase
MPNKITLSMEKIEERIRSYQFPEVDGIVGIASGGIYPAKLIAQFLNLPLRMITINFRSSDNTPRYSSPQLIKMDDISTDYKKLLLVDDVSVSGKTLQIAKKHLRNYQIKTCVLKGQADFVLFPEIKTCVNWPWKQDTTPPL